VWVIINLLRAIIKVIAFLSTLVVGFWLLGVFRGSSPVPTWMMSIWKLGCSGIHPVRVIEVVVLLGAFVAGFWMLGRFRRTVVENQGEAAVRRALTQNFSGTAYHLLNNITLPFEDGTTQVDHVLVSKYGIFVIESKHYSGWIFANASWSTWTQVIYYYKQSFQNPLRQNYKHIKAIQKVLDFVPLEHIHSLVAFTGNAVFKTERPAEVFDVASLIQHIEQFTTEVLTENRLQFCVGRLECHRKSISGKTDVEHQEYLNRKHSDAT
jgi:hypothetical protein